MEWQGTPLDAHFSTRLLLGIPDVIQNTKDYAGENPADSDAEQRAGENQ